MSGNARSTRIVLGTASLGQRYGLPRPDGTRPELDPRAAVTLLRDAAALGVRRIDTAPAYGDAEARIGTADVELEIWTKVSGEPGIGIRSLDASLERLRRARIAGLQWHNWTAALGAAADFHALWKELRADERIGRLGATTYGSEDAGAAVSSGLFDSVQVEWNVLNPGVVRSLRRGTGVEICVRSVYLQGALTDEGRTLPPSPRLAAAIDSLRDIGREAGLGLTEIALRSALFEPGIDRVVLGIDDPKQLEIALAHEARGPLDSDVRARLEDVALGGVADVDPRHWARLTR